MALRLRSRAGGYVFFVWRKGLCSYPIVFAPEYDRIMDKLSAAVSKSIFDIRQRTSKVWYNINIFHRFYTILPRCDEIAAFEDF